MVDWLEHVLLPGAVALGVILLVLWPTTHSGTRLLKTWGIPEPTDDQVTTAVRYLRQRRLLLAVLWVFAPWLLRFVTVDTDLPGLQIFVPLLVAMVIAELIATLRPVSGVRVAFLDRRDWRDLVPRWAILATAAAAALAVGLAVAGLFVAPGPGGSAGKPWQALGYAVGHPVLVIPLIALAVRRPAVPDQAVDAALRARTARVAVGIGFGWLSASILASSNHLRLDYAGPLALAGGIVCWLWVATPSRRSLVRR